MLRKETWIRSPLLYHSKWERTCHFYWKQPWCTNFECGTRVESMKCWMLCGNLHGDCDLSRKERLVCRKDMSSRWSAARYKISSREICCPSSASNVRFSATVYTLQTEWDRWNAVWETCVANLHQIDVTSAWYTYSDHLWILETCSASNVKASAIVYTL